MKFFIRLFLTIVLLTTGGSVLQAAYSSLYVFGDALSCTGTSPNPSPIADYYNQHWSNGRIWIEVLAQRQGLTYDSSKNNSYYDHNSKITAADVKNLSITPANASNALFIVWVCNSDTFDAASAQDSSTDWTKAIKQAQTNHLQIITNLYAKGVRTLIMPNAVDISRVPSFNIGTSTLTNNEHNGCVAYNVAFSNTISQAIALCPGLKIYTPDFYSLLNNVLTNAAAYGLTNALSSSGLSIDAINALYKHANTVPLNGAGTNYIFWDPQDPTAKFHEVIADVAQQIISPVQISRIVTFNGSNRLDVANVPVGLGGFVDNCTNLAPANWAAVQNFSSTNTAQSVFVLVTNSTQTSQFAPMDIIPGPGGTPILTALQFYRLHFPYAWSWP